MTKSESFGKCSFCSGVFSKRLVLKHLASCEKRVSLKPSNSESSGFTVLVEGRHAPCYWLYLSVPAGESLKKLDDFLRKTWLECCGHLSAFEINEEKYFSDKESAIELDGKDMNSELDKVVSLGEKFYYEYDFGSTTELTLKIVDKQTADSVKISLMARNLPPEIKCDSCNKPAVDICAQCIDEGKGGMCEKCGEKHECGDEMLLPVVNSPRLGVCGYTGELC